MAITSAKVFSNNEAPQELENMPSKDSEQASNTDDNDYVHHQMNRRLFLALTAMAFLWIGSQIPLYIFGSVLPLIYEDIGGYDRYVWLVIGYLIPNAAFCPFVGALSDIYGRRRVAIAGQVALILGSIITSTAQSMNIAICGQVFAGLGGGLNELIALAGTAALVPIAKRGTYVSAIVFTVIPFCPSALWAQLIAKVSSWRYCGILIGAWNFLGLIFVMTLYKDVPFPAQRESRSAILHKIDYVGGLLSITGCILSMMGLQWGAAQYSWDSAHVLVPLVMGVALLAAFFIWEIRFAKFPMAPRKLFSLEKSAIIIVLLITFVSGGNYFVLLVMWPSQVYNVYGSNPIDVGLRTLPMGFGIIGGSIIALAMLPHIKGRIREQMIFFTFMMTAFCGSMAAATPHNINTVYALVLFASIGVGGVIIPSSIIAQIACPQELIGTITAITLSIRNIGGAIAFTAYDNVLQHRYHTISKDVVAIKAIIEQGVVAPTNLPLVTELTTLVGQFRLKELRQVIESNPGVMRKHEAFSIITTASQEAFAIAYRYPYYISIAFGGVTCILALFLKDIRKYMVVR